MLIGIFGGSFNPVHKGHIFVARQVLKLTTVEEIWFMVTPHNPFKKHDDMIDDNLRLEMTREALRNEEGMFCSDYEFHLPQPSYMWNTLQSLSKDYPDDTFVLIIGADNWLRFHEWRNYEDILARHEVIIYPRRGYETDAASLPKGVTLLNPPLCDISASEIRKRLSEGKNVKEMAPGGVVDMVERNRNQLK